MIMHACEEKIAKVLSSASRKIREFISEVESEASDELRKLYKGKVVKCECFDSWIEGSDYLFNQELLDITVRRTFDDMFIRFYVTVTVMYKSPFAGRDSVPKPTRFYLRNILRGHEKSQ